MDPQGHIQERGCKLRFISTKDYAANGIKMLVHGQAGIGKTCLCASLPKPIIISVESGLLSLAGLDIPAIEVKTMDDLIEAFSWLTETEEGRAYESICLDSISEIAEVILSDEKGKEKDPRKAYGNMQDIMMQVVRDFRDIPGKNIYMSAKQERIQDENNRLLFGPSMPGQKLAQQLPYLFDEIFCYQIVKDQNGVPQRVLLTQPDGISQAKDRSGKLDMWEKPDLGKIINKIRS